MTGVAETSIQALKQKREEGSLETDKARCRFIIYEYGPLTMKDMEMHMGKRKNAFSGRVNDLKDEGLVEVAGVEDNHQVLKSTEADDYVSVDADLEEEDLGDLFIEKEGEEAKPEPGEVIYSG